MTDTITLPVELVKKMVNSLADSYLYVQEVRLKEEAAYGKNFRPYKVAATRAVEEAIEDTFADLIPYLKGDQNGH